MISGTWKNSVLKLSSLALLRWINFKSIETKKVELQIFADASSKAYGAAAYINVTNTNSKHCNLVLGKSRTAPMKNKLTTIPRLELQAALLASRIKLTVTLSLEKYLYMKICMIFPLILILLKSHITNIHKYLITKNN